MGVAKEGKTGGTQGSDMTDGAPTFLWRIYFQSSFLAPMIKRNQSLLTGRTPNGTLGFLIRTNKCNPANERR